VSSEQSGSESSMNWYREAALLQRLPATDF